MLVRILVGATLGLALVVFAVLSLPRDLPAIALGQPGLYRLEVALAVLYGCLLMLTPAYSGLARGRLPVEISTRGAKFAEESDLAAERYEATIRELELTTKRLSQDLERAVVEIARLDRKEGDKT
jgi:hypothetical protein